MSEREPSRAAPRDSRTPSSEHIIIIIITLLHNPLSINTQDLKRRCLRPPAAVLWNNSTRASALERLGALNGAGWKGANARLC